MQFVLLSLKRRNKNVVPIKHTKSYLYIGLVQRLVHHLTCWTLRGCVSHLNIYIGHMAVNPILFHWRRIFVISWFWRILSSILEMCVSYGHWEYNKDVRRFGNDICTIKS